ncbi:MAG: flavodoxin domain-containing protein [Glaciecola sp.]|jgi:MioC protein
MSNHVRPVQIIIGSVLGATEYVAEAISEVCIKHNIPTQLHFSPSLSDIPTDATWIICTSTHGAGELPDNIQGFHASLSDKQLSNQALVVGLGDSSYDTYCQGAIIMSNALTNAGTTLLHAPFLVDVLHHQIPEDEVVEWITPLLSQLSHNSDQ